MAGENLVELDVPDIVKERHAVTRRISSSRATSWSCITADFFTCPWSTITSSTS